MKQGEGDKEHQYWKSFWYGSKKELPAKNVKRRHLLELKEYAEQVDTRGEKEYSR